MAQLSTSKLADFYFLSIKHILAEFLEHRFTRGLLQLFFKGDVAKNWTCVCSVSKVVPVWCEQKLMFHCGAEIVP